MMRHMWYQILFKLTFLTTETTPEPDPQPSTSWWENLFGGITGFFANMVELLRNVVGFCKSAFELITWLFNEVLFTLGYVLTFPFAVIVGTINQDWTNQTPPMDRFLESGSHLDFVPNILRNMDLGMWNINAFIAEGISWFRKNLDSIATISEMETEGSLFGVVQSLQTQLSGISPLIGSFDEVVYPKNLNVSLFLGHFRFLVGDMLYQLMCISIIFLAVWMFYELCLKLFEIVKKIIRVFI